VTGPKAAAPVEVTNPDPIPVEVVESEAAAQRAPELDQHSRERPQSKAQENEEALTTEGQRGINRLWERTQSIIAVSVVEVTLIVVAVLIIAPILNFNDDPAVATAGATALVLLSNLVGNVTGFYFSRTNHQKIGGVGGGSRVGGR
jgi:hypothetical protein